MQQKGLFYTGILPMIITNVKSGTPAYKDELFGPVAPVFIVKDEKEAIMIANDTEFGLEASIWLQDFTWPAGWQIK
jgi:succinate-semialdehyde dehydrogenase / glutarate-semialdehyde dehydrogenase